MQMTAYPRPISQQSLCKELLRKKRQRSTEKKDNSIKKPNVFIFSKKSAVTVTVVVDQPICKLSVKLNNNSLGISWRNKSDLQTVYTKNIKIESSKYQEPYMFWQVKNNTILINLTEKSSQSKRSIKSSL